MYVNVYIMAVYVCMMLSTVRNKLYSANVNKKEKKKKKKLSMFAQVCNPSYLQASITENSGCARMFCVRYVWICVDFAHYPQMCMCNVCFFFFFKWRYEASPPPLAAKKGSKVWHMLQNNKSGAIHWGELVLGRWVGVKVNQFELLFHSWPSDRNN